MLVVADENIADILPGNRVVPGGAALSVAREAAAKTEKAGRAGA